MGATVWFHPSLAFSRRASERRPTAAVHLWQAILAGKTDGRSWEYLAEFDGNVVGFGSCGPQRDPDLKRKAFTGEVFGLYVLKSAHRRGVGTSLMAAMADQLFQAGYGAYSLWVLNGNRPARECYERLGGAVVGEKTEARDYGSLLPHRRPGRRR